MLRLSPLAFFALAVAACAPADGTVGATTSPIARGMPEPGYPAVVAVYDSALMGLCTGTLIAPRVVLTAKHCVQQQGTSSPDPASVFTVLIGMNVNAPSATYSVQTVRTTPNPYNSTNDLQNVDIATLVLTRAVTGVTPIDIRRDRPTDQVGTDVLVIGYGETPGGTAGTKYSGHTHIQSISGTEIYATGTTCHGDSGGPMLTGDGRVFGVTSYGFGSCGSGIDGHNGLFSMPLLAIIDASLAEGAVCTNDGPEMCDGHDNNCDGAIDEVCTPLGHACDPAHDVCYAALPCATNPVTGTTLCTQPCSPLTPLTGCPMGLYCVQNGPHSCDGVCIPGHAPDAASAKPVGAACTDNTECATMFCVDPGDGTRRCLQPCQGDGGQCLSDEACADTVGACNACVAASIVIGSRGVGETCMADADCGSRQCLDDLGVHYCTHACTTDAECPAVGYHCRGDQMVCVHGRREGIGGTCSSNADCDPSAGICASRGAAHWCTQLCGGMDPMTHMPVTCPVGFDCTDTAGPGSPQLCVPSSGLVGESCTVATDCISGTCTDAVCTRACNSETPCSTGTECVRAADGSASCRPPPPPVVMPPPMGGGCTVSGPATGSGSGSGALFFVVALGLVALRRRRVGRVALLLASLLAAALLFAGCATGPIAPEVAATSESIAGGVFESGFPAVVFITNSPGGGFTAACTGSVIGPRVILTARHCVSDFDRAGNPLARTAPASNFEVYVGSTPFRATETHMVSAVRIASDTWDVGDGSDVAVLELATPTAIPPIRYATGSPYDLLGHPVTAIGYGQLPDGSSGTKYRVSAGLEGVASPPGHPDALFIEVDPSLCEGDSGGPALSFDMQIYGVASFITSPDGMTAPTCGSAPGVYTAIQPWITSLIEPALMETGTCLPGAETCNGLDDNCDGTIDEGCTAFGGACTDSSRCTSMNCASTPGGMICTQACDPLSPGLGCPPDFFCARQSGCAGLCVPGSAGAKGNGDACADDTECASLLCVDPGDGHRRCLAPCRGDHGACESGEACAAVPEDCGACVAASLLAPPRHLGEPCADDMECASAHCQHDDRVSYCSRACAMDVDCDVGYRCRSGFCHHGLPEGTGGPCASNEDCASPDLCATLGSRSWCTAICTSATGCPMGYTCDSAGSVSVCAPHLALVGEHCAVNSECASGLCELGSGTCTRLCDVDQPCPTGFDCDRAGTIAVCLRPAAPPMRDRGGCSVPRSATGGTHGAAAMLVLALVLVRLRRRKAQ